MNGNALELEVELDPCPFCGNSEEIEILENDAGYFFIRCPLCGGRGPVGDNGRVASVGWNLRREDIGAAVEVLRR